MLSLREDQRGGTDLPQPDPRKIQLNLTGFLEKDTPIFCKQLWNLLLSAQSNPVGVPTELLEAKKEELRLAKVRVFFFCSPSRREVC